MTAIKFAHAVALWTSLYARAFAQDADGMRHQLLQDTLISLCKVFGEKFHLSLYAAQNDDWNHLQIG